MKTIKHVVYYVKPSLIKLSQHLTTEKFSDTEECNACRESDENCPLNAKEKGKWNKDHGKHKGWKN